MEPVQRNREELIAVVQKIREAKGTEEELHRDLALLRQAVLDPKVTDYIFWSKEELTAEQVVDKALQYKPILL
jgi:hypothetical protein